MTFFINHIFLAFFNLVNSRIDAYRIMRNKTIAHGINFGAYLVFTAFVGYWYIRNVTGWTVVAEIILLGLSAFCNRQFSFDIPLNLRRGKKWDYVSLAKPPKSLLDRFEINLFGYNGRAPFLMYGVVFIICIIIKAVWL